jgi:hypothetical protein
MSETPPPIRLQLSVTLGFSFQDVGHAANGLPTVKVARPSKWGNWIARKQALTSGVAAVEAFEDWLDVLLRFVNQTCAALDRPTQQAPATKH